MRGERFRQAKVHVRRVLRSWRANQCPNSRQRDPDVYADNGRIGRRMRYARQPCSCMGCGNQRKHVGLTPQEIRASDIADCAHSEMTNEVPD